MIQRSGTIAVIGACLALATSATAGETVTYQYDALGRLIGASAAGGPESGTATSIGYDPAGNRTRYAVSGAGAVSALNAKFIVVPLNGYTLIPIPSSY